MRCLRLKLMIRWCLTTIGPCLCDVYYQRSLKKIMYSRLIDFLDTYKIVVENQFGFRKMLSSYMALMTMMDKLIQSLENDEYVIGIFLDFSKAFDTVDHTILLSKLHHYGIRGNAMNLFTSYLSDRK